MFSRVEYSLNQHMKIPKFNQVRIPSLCERLRCRESDDGHRFASFRSGPAAWATVPLLRRRVTVPPPALPYYLQPASGLLPRARSPADLLAAKQWPRGRMRGAIPETRGMPERIGRAGTNLATLPLLYIEWGIGRLHRLPPDSLNPLDTKFASMGQSPKDFPEGM